MYDIILDPFLCCPICGSSDYGVSRIVEIFDKIDEDEEFEYYFAKLEFQCFFCGNIFYDNGTVIKRKQTNNLKQSF